MIEVRIVNNGIKSVISSKTVKELLESIADTLYISDISSISKEKDVMLFDCKLDRLTFKFSYFDGINYEEFDIGEEYYQMLFEDIDGYISNMLDEIEDELKIMCNFDDIRLRHEIYDLNDSFSDVKFVIAVTFKKRQTSQLIDIARMTAKRQVQGSSRFYN